MKNLLLAYFLLSFTALSAQTPEIAALKELVSQKANLPDSMVLPSLDYLFEEYMYRRDTIQSLYYANLLIEEAKERNHLFYERQGYLNKAARYLIPNRTIGKPIIDSILNIAINEKDSLLMSQCYNYLGMDILVRNQQDTGCYYFNKAIDVLGKRKTKEVVEAIIPLAYATANKGDTRKALTLATKGLEIARVLKNKVLIAKVLNKLSGYHYYFNEYDKVSTFLIEAIQLSEEQNYGSIDLITNYMTLADLYWVRNSDLDKAQFYTKKAYELGKNSSHNSLRLSVILGQAYYHIIGDKHDFTLAKPLIIKVLNESIELDLTFRQAVSHFYLGILYSQQDSFEQAYPHFIESIQLCEKVGNKSYQQRVEAFLTEELQIRDKAIPNFIDTIELALDNLDGKIWSLKIKRNIALQKQDYKNAQQYEAQLNKLSLQLKEEECRINVEEQLLACELEEQEEKLVLKEALIANTTFKNQLLSAASIVTLFFLGILYFLYRTKNRLNQEITQKNEKISAHSKQLAVFNEDLASKNDLLAKKNTLQEKEIVDFIAFQNKRDYELGAIKAEITKAMANNTPTVAALQLLNNQVGQLVSDENDWLYFKQKIAGLYPNFFKNLLLNHPNLNEREQLHCAYILLGMSVKKVSESIFVSIKAVESARYRIKKKMGLDKTDNLSEYIRNFGTNN